MPASIKLQEEYGDDLAVIFVESQGADQDTMERFALKRKWLAKGSMWTLEAPLRVEGNTLPKFALLSADGELLLSGNPLAMKKQIETAIEEEVSKARRGPDDLPKELKKAWGEFAKGNYAKAIAAAHEVAESKPEVAEAAMAYATDFEARAQREIERVSRLVSLGRLDRAEELADSLGKGVADHEALSAALAKQVERLSGDEAKRELEASKAFAKAFEATAGKGKADKHQKAFAKIASKYEGTKAGERAARFARLLEDA